MKIARYALYTIVALALVAACVITIFMSTSKSAERAARSTVGAADPGPHTLADARPSFVGAPESMKSRRLKDKAARAALFQAILQAQRRRQGVRIGSAERDPSDQGQASGEAPIGELDEEYIRDAIKEVIPEIRSCYETVLREAPALEGRLIVSFSILGEPDLAGMIDDIKVEDESDEVMRSSAPLKKCVIDALFAMEFSPPENGGVVNVRYPFSFAAKDK